MVNFFAGIASLIALYALSTAAVLSAKLFARYFANNIKRTFNPVASQPHSITPEPIRHQHTTRTSDRPFERRTPTPKPPEIAFGKTVMTRAEIKEKLKL